MKDKSPEGWKKKKKEYVNIIKSVKLEQKWNLGGKKCLSDLKVEENYMSSMEKKILVEIHRVWKFISGNFGEVDQKARHFPGITWHRFSRKKPIKGKMRRLKLSKSLLSSHTKYS